MICDCVGAGGISPYSIRSFQVKAAQGCVLAHCMGLGKTLQVVALLQALLRPEAGAGAGNVKHEVRTVLVCAPLNVLLNWCDEFDKWVPDSGIDVYCLTDAGSSNPKRARMLQEWSARPGSFSLAGPAGLGFVDWR